jgi:lysophospholipase L1-like esterase
LGHGPLNERLLTGLLGALLPLSAAQGLWLKGRATRLPGAAGKRSGLCGNGKELSLLAIGDSIIDGVGAGHISKSLPVQFARQLAERNDCAVNWRVEGKSGWDVMDLHNHLDGLGDLSSPQVILISIGVNDVTGLTRRAQWQERLRRLLRRCRTRWPQARILFCGLPPMQHFPLLPQPLRATLAFRAGQFDRLAAAILEEFPPAAHIPTRISPDQHSFCEDGFHPSADSCKLWARELASLQKGDLSA